MRVVLRILGALLSAGVVLVAGFWLLLHTDSPLPAHWNPLAELDVAAPQTPLTTIHLRRALASDGACFAALQDHARFERMDPLQDTEDCFIDPRLRLSGVGEVALAPVETTCAVALRLAMWERHSLRDAAETLGSPIAELRHFSSYNCRPIRTSRGTGTRMSSHATAEAIDIRGVRLADGRAIPLLDNWEGESSAAVFWRAARDGACTWFRTTLGPDYNRLHADHFHLQSTGWGLCR